MNNSHCNAASSSIVLGASGDPLLTRSRVAAVAGGIADDGGDKNALHDGDDSRAAAVAAGRKEQVIRPILHLQRFTLSSTIDHYLH